MEREKTFNKKKTINGRQPGKKQEMSSKTRRQPWVKNN
jgi:hypothetical protein